MPVEVKKRWAPPLFIAVGLVMVGVGAWMLLDPEAWNNISPGRLFLVGCAQLIGGVCLIVLGVRGELWLRRRR